MIQTNKMTRVLTTEQAARALRVSKRTLEDWRRLRCGPAFLRPSRDRRNGAVYYLPQELERFAETRKAKQAAPLRTRAILKKSKNRKRK